MREGQVRPLKGVPNLGFNWSLVGFYYDFLGIFLDLKGLLRDFLDFPGFSRIFSNEIFGIFQSDLTFEYANIEHFEVSRKNMRKRQHS